MKKLLLSTTFLIAGAFSILAQGIVSFDNYPASFPADGFDRYVYADTVGGTKATDPSWEAGLYELRSGSYVLLTVPPAAGSGLCAFSSTDPGIWAWEGENRTISVAKGIDTTLQVKVLKGGVEIGASAPFTYKHQINEPPGAYDTYMINFRAFAVPEPSTIALGVLGLGALLLFRRRK